MKYYAVADSPNELMHYGVKGMKWGQHIFGDKQQKSPGYKKAVSKLRASMKDGIKKSQAKWRASVVGSGRMETSSKRYNEAALAKERARKEAMREMRREASAIRRDKRRMDRYMQQAREGRLKYGKLSDEQVQMVTNRLALERQARMLSGTEKPSFIKRVRGAMAEGAIQGIARGEAAYVEARMRGRGEYKAYKKYGAKRAREEARNQAKKNRIIAKQELRTERKLAKQQAQNDVDQEYYKMLAETGEKRGRWERFNPHAKVNRQKRLIEYRDLQERKEFDNAMQRDLIRNFYNKGKGETAEAYKQRIISDDFNDDLRQLGYRPVSTVSAFTKARIGTQRLSKEEQTRRRGMGARTEIGYKDIGRYINIMPTSEKAISVQTNGTDTTPFGNAIRRSYSWTIARANSARNAYSVRRKNKNR